jgi:thioredoxin 1
MNSMVVSLTEDAFDTTVLDAQTPVLVDFTASWCPPCKAQAPILDRLAAELGEGAVIAKVDVDAEPGLAQRYHVHSIPTLLVVKDGKVVERFQGLTRGETLRNALLA